MKTHIGIIGAGAIGIAFASRFLKAGHHVTLSNSRGPQSLADTVATLGGNAEAGTVAQAAAAEIVVLAVPWKHLHQALEGITWSEQIVMDTTNPIIPPGFTIADLGGRTSSEVVASLVLGARLVKAGNTLPPEIITQESPLPDGRRVLFLSGDDADAKARLSQVLDQSGFASVDLGSLVEGGRLQQFPGGPLPALNLIKLS